ncbi:MAG: DUF4838 domain-containing protein [Planctomycetota bacterium]
MKLNYIAGNIEKDYPEILIETHAVNATTVPPLKIRPRKNVIIAWCDVYSWCDAIRPLNHPLNKNNYNEIRRWGKIAPRLGIGDDYWTALSFYKKFPTPYSLVRSITSDIRLFARCGARTMFVPLP